MKRLFILLLIGIILLISGCVDVEEFETYDETRKADHIGSFSIYKDGDVYKISFDLKDKDDDWTTEDGHVHFKILDKSDKVVYEEEFDITRNDFKEFWEYRWRVSFSDVEKSVYDDGVAVLIFTTADGRMLNATDDYVTIPQYSDEEIEAIYEEKWLQSAKSIGETMTRGNFEVTLVRVGYFTHLKYDEEITDFRADIKVKNIGTESETFDKYDAAIVVGDSQYNYDRSEIDTSGIYPGVIKEGYILYEDVPEGLSGSIKVIVGGSYGYEISTLRWVDFLYSFDIEL